MLLEFDGLKEDSVVFAAIAIMTIYDSQLGRLLAAIKHNLLSMTGIYSLSYNFGNPSLCNVHCLDPKDIYMASEVTEKKHEKHRYVNKSYDMLHCSRQ